MYIQKSEYKETTYFQIYLTKEEMKNEETQEKINSLKKPNTRVAIFVSGESNYLKVLERIIISRVEKVNGL